MEAAAGGNEEVAVPSLLSAGGGDPKLGYDHQGRHLALEGPAGHLNQDAEESMYCGLRFNGGPSPENFPAAFLQSFVKATTSETKGKNCRDDEAVDLFVVEELLRLLDECATPDAGEGDLEQEDTVDEDLVVVEDVPDEEEMMDLEDLLRPVPQDTENVLTGMACSKLAAPIVEQLMSTLKCPECKTIMQTEPEFPVHIHHTMTAGPSDLFKLQPTVEVATVVQQINTRALKQVQPFFHRPGILKRFVQIASHMPAVRKFKLCERHGSFKNKFLYDLCVKILKEDIKKKNIAYKESKSRSVQVQNLEDASVESVAENMPSTSTGISRKSTKYQRLSHL